MLQTCIKIQLFSRLPCGSWHRPEFWAEVGRDKGLRWRDIPPAVERMGYRVEKLPEYQNATFIFTDRDVA